MSVESRPRDRRRGRRRSRTEMLELLARLVEAPTTLGNEEPGQAIMDEAFRELVGLEPVGHSARRRALALRIRAPRRSTGTSRGKRNVVADWPAAGAGGRSLVLNGHVDVVGPASERLWRSRRRSPRRRDGDWLYGRGAGDMKAGLAAIVGAVAGLAAARLSPARTRPAAVGGRGGVRRERRAAVRARRACGPTRPSFPSRTRASSRRRRSASSGSTSTSPARRRTSPRHRTASTRSRPAYAVVRELHVLEEELNADPPPPFDTIPHPINFNVGVISGGDWPSTVAAECTLSCRLATYPGTPIEDLRARASRRPSPAPRRRARTSPSTRRVVRYSGFAIEGTSVGDDEPIVRAVAAAWEAVTGR